MEVPNFLPLGSVVVVRGSTKKLMVIARALALKQKDGPRYYDYGGCLYPEGLLGDKVVYFNHDAIQHVFFEGFADADNDIMLENLKTNVSKITIRKGDPSPIVPPTGA